MIKQLVLTAAVALVCAGCFGSAHNSEQCREWDFNGERLCRDPETADVVVWFRGVEEGDMEGMTIEISPDDAATNRLEETTPIVANEDIMNSWDANIARTGDGISRLCFADGVHVEDPSTGLRWQILKRGECRSLAFDSFALSRAVWE